MIDMKSHWQYRGYGIWPQQYEFVVVDANGNFIGRFPTTSAAKEEIDKIEDKK